MGCARAVGREGGPQHAWGPEGNVPGVCGYGGRWYAQPNELTDGKAIILRS